MSMNKSYLRSLLIVLFLFGGFAIFNLIKSAHASSWFTVDGHVIDSYMNGCGYCDPPKAPTGIQILIHGGGNFDGATNFQWDCDNDGKYESSGSGTLARGFNPGDGTVMIEWGNGWGLSSHSWNVYGGGENEYWYELTTSCSYQTGGQKKVNIKGARGGVTATSSVNFSLQDRTYNFRVDFPAGGAYHPPINDPRGVKESGTRVPTNVDLGIGMKEDGRRYQNDADAWGFDTSGFTYTTDCNGDGKFDDGSSSSNNSNFYIYPGYPPKWYGATFASNVCRFDKPGIRQINMKIIAPGGREYRISKDVSLSPSDSFGIQITPSYVEQTVPFSVNYSATIKGLIPVSYGGYNIRLYCDENDTQPKGVSGNRSDYTPDGTLTKNIGTCLYDKTGDYKAKVRFEETGHQSAPFNLSGDGFVDILAGGGIEACNFDGKPKEATVAKGTRLDLRWKTVNTDGCVATEGTPNILELSPQWVGNKKNEGTSGTYSVPTGSMSGLYIFKLSCFRGAATAPMAITPMGECRLRVK